VDGVQVRSDRRSIEEQGKKSRLQNEWKAWGQAQKGG